MAECMATGRTGATTVVATMIAARLAGIDIFATGGPPYRQTTVPEAYEAGTDCITARLAPVYQLRECSLP